MAVPSSLRGIWTSIISPKGMNAAKRRSLVVSAGNEETWIVAFARCVPVAAIVETKAFSSRALKRSKFRSMALLFQLPALFNPNPRLIHLLGIRTFPNFPSEDNQLREETLRVIHHNEPLNPSPPHPSHTHTPPPLCIPPFLPPCTNTPPVANRPPTPPTSTLLPRRTQRRQTPHHNPHSRRNLRLSPLLLLCQLGQNSL